MTATDVGASVAQGDLPLRQVISAIESDLGVIRSQSRFYRTPAFPPGSGPEFLNAAFALESDLAPDALLSALHKIEADMGRVRSTRWGPRTLDLDMLMTGHLVLPDAVMHKTWVDLPFDEQMQRVPDRLLLPHPRLQDRAFVLVPLMDIAPTWVHPVSGASVREMHDALPEAARAEIIPL